MVQGTNRRIGTDVVLICHISLISKCAAGLFFRRHQRRKKEALLVSKTRGAFCENNFRPWAIFRRNSSTIVVRPQCRRQTLPPAALKWFHTWVYSRIFSISHGDCVNHNYYHLLWRWSLNFFLNLAALNFSTKLDLKSALRARPRCARMDYPIPGHF